MRSAFVTVLAGAALVGLMPTDGHAQGVGGVYTGSPLTTIERSQQNQLDANRFAITKENQGRFQNQLDLERMTYDEARRQREGYLFQDNTSQRALETELREQDLRLRQQDQDNRERELKQRQEEAQADELARLSLGGSAR
jgi:hypothetical protein